MNEYHKKHLTYNLNRTALQSQVGKVSSSRPGPDDGLTLADIRFVIGDYLDVAIVQPQMQQGNGFGGGGGFNGGFRS